MPDHDAPAIAEQIEQFIRSQFSVSPSDTRFNRRVSLWEAGYVDSLGVAELMAFLEAQFRVRVPDDYLFSPDFTHIDGIAEIVYRLRADRVELRPADPAQNGSAGAAAAPPRDDRGASDGDQRDGHL
jgi:acyl carrier protein